MLEWYRLDADYRQLMDDCECLLAEVVDRMAKDVVGTASGGEADVFLRFDLERPWPRLSVEDAFRRYSPLSLERSMAGDCFEEMLVEHIEPNLGCDKPLFSTIILSKWPPWRGKSRASRPGRNGLSSICTGLNWPMDFPS